MTTAHEGIRVIDASRHMAGAMTGMLFSDNGADVIKVEAPGGDPTRVHDGFKVWNRNKRSVILDLKDVEDKSNFYSLIETADVLITDFRQGALKRLGIEHDQLQIINPGLV